MCVLCLCMFLVGKDHNDYYTLVLERREQIMIKQQVLTRRQAAFRSEIFPNQFNYLIQQEPFSSYLIKDGEHEWLVNSEVIPIIKDYYTTHNHSFHYYNAHPDYLIAYQVAPILNKTNMELLSEIQKGTWDDMIVKVPRLAPPKVSYIAAEKFHYFFLKSELFKNQYNTIEQIALKTTLISRTRLQEYRNLGLLPQPDHLKGTNLYNEKEILEILPKLKMEFKKQTPDSKNHNAFDLLSSEQQQLITKYLKYRENSGVTEYEGYRSSPSIANKKKTLETMKSKLSSTFILIISGRCGIEEDFHKNPLNRNKVPAAFNPEVFDVLNISKDDYAFLASNRAPMTLHQIYHKLRPFYYFLLENFEEEAIESDDLKDFRDFRRIALRVKKFLQQFPHTINEINQSDYEQKTKSFLTREQMILIKQYILEDVRTIDPIKNATMWQVSCTIGVRPEELPQLKINHFKLNAEGFIDQDENGWGNLMLPAPISKKGNSPSHRDFHTPVPKSTVNQLNQYLTRLYKRQGENNPRGQGYLFRPDYTLPNLQTKRIRFRFIERLRKRLDFLEENQRKDFIFKASRHSLNNTIMRTFITEDHSLNEAKRTASDHQLRHKPTKTVGEEYYLDDITKEQYYQVLDATINFPWDLEKLVLWEIEKGYRISVNPIQKEPEENVEFQQQLRRIEEQLDVIVEKPKHMTELQWTKQRHMLLEQKNMILSQKRGGG